MANYRRQEIRARITIGDLVIETPDVISFNVTRTRGQMAATFSASIKVRHDEISESIELLDKGITIEAGTVTNMKKIFTGIVYKCTINPIRTDASKVILNLSGSDVMSVLEGQYINRRVKTYRDGEKPPERWAAVTGIVKRDIPQSMKFPVRLLDKKTKAVDKIPFIPSYTISNEIAKPIDRNIPEIHIGAPTIERVVTEE